MANENSWRTKAYRQVITAKLEVAVRKSGCDIKCIDQENQFFLKAKSKKEYLRLVSAFISHLNSIDELEKTINQKQSSCQQFPATINNTSTDNPILAGTSLITCKQIQNLVVKYGASDEQTYQEEIRGLNKYIEPLKQMTAKLGVEDFIQLSDVTATFRMILSSPRIGCLDVLKKCKGVLDSFFAKKGIEVKDKAYLNTDITTMATSESIPKPTSTLEPTDSRARIWLKSDLFSPAQQSENTSAKSPDAKEQTQTSQPSTSELPTQHTSKTINSTKEVKEVQQLVIDQPTVSNTIDEAGPSTSRENVNGRYKRFSAVAKNQIWKVTPSTSRSESDSALPPLRLNFTLKRLRRNKKAYTSEQLKRLYYMKKIEIAQFELYSKKVLHKLECSIKRRQLEKLR